MRASTSILVLVASLIVAWLLMSSIHFIQPSSSAQQQQQSQQQRGSTGGGGSSGFQGLNFSIPQFKLPKVSLPDLNFSFLPHFNSGNTSLPSAGIGSGTGSGSGSGSGSGGGSGSGSGSGYGSGPGSGSGNSGSSNFGNGVSTATGTTNVPGATNSQKNSLTVTNTSTQKATPLTIPNQLVLIIVLVIIVLATLFTVISRRSLGRQQMRKPQAQSQELMPPESILPKVELSPPAFLAPVELGAEELVVPFQGWGNQGGFIRPEINPELPLIWSVSKPLKIEVPNGSILDLQQSNSEGIEKLSETSYSVKFKETCNTLSAASGNARDKKFVRAVHYNEDVIKHFRLNFFKISEDELQSLTPRELVGVLTSKYKKEIADSTKLFELIRIFEKAFYGRKEISRADYEDFLISLSRSLANPKVIICGTKDAKNVS